MNTKVYIKPDVIIEPLFDYWYAWLHLISPVTAARNTVNRHIPIMQSYLKASAAHMAANKNPNLRGGPFIDYAESRVSEINHLLSETIESRNDLIELSAAIDTLNNIIKTFPKGVAVSNLYRDVPEVLRGFIELGYDTHNNLSYRFIETLVYQSQYYKKDAQSLAVWFAKEPHRPFALSTPRLPTTENEVVHIRQSFDATIVDALGEMKFKPQSADTVFDMLTLNSEEKRVFQSFFTNSRESTYTKCKPNQIRVRYFGHACVLLETDYLSIMIDPVVAYKRHDMGERLFTYADLPEQIDYVLLSHNHQDHILLETLLPLRHKIKNIVVPRSLGGSIQDPSIKLALMKIGFKNVITLDEMETIAEDDCSITGIPFFGEHGDLNILAKTCYRIQIYNQRFLFTVDSNVIEKNVFKLVNDALGDIDVLFMGMECAGAPMSWLYGPLMSERLPRENDETRRLNGSNYIQGIELVNIFKPKEVYIYAMGQEQYVEFISSIKYTNESPPIVESNKLVADCRGRGLKSERLFGAKELNYTR